MDEGLFKRLNLRDFLKDSPFLNPLKEHYPDYLRQLLERTLDYWNQRELEKAKEHIATFNSNFDGFQIGKLIELAIDFKEIDAEKTIVYLDSIPETQREETSTAFAFHFVKAVLYFSLWDIDKARDECDKAISFDNKLGVTYYLRGTCYALRELHSRAIPDYKKALKDDYKKNEITANLAYSYLRTQNHRKALRLHKRIVDKFPENDKVQYNTGLCFKRFKKHKKAVKYFNKAIQLNPENAGYKLTRGRVLMRLKRHKEAESDLQFAFDSSNQISGALLRINSEVLENKISSRQANKKVLDLIRNKNSS
ncbi:tetratricopeptide repeat protein [Croceimicrobium hydrocarbonivorans]|uniref:Tetratricopeptide repeat protein n=1 Tax=Croceimicrobium hydrocarbonivorans TaxID=2761580 RepID=A0A7H0VHA3_9FLAO|nr:tetratricopeptide repeat protein [Croceimicrobium hydrocarbonivorans]QNR25101.1 tetratricopeptide repeat protein [Croceimicrobium hydrocarbonivorans]